MGPKSLNLMYGKLLTYRELNDEDSLVEMRAAVKMHAADMGFSLINQTKLVTAASELGRNVIEHGLGGAVKIEQLASLGRIGLRMIFTDSGPGIEDMSLALSVGFTSKKGLGLGLSGSKRLMDEFEIESAAGCGTTVVVTKWT
jgi:serine/threonine-protein kinase RsbT